MRKNFKFGAVLLLFGLFLLSFRPAEAGTTISNSSINNPVWTAENSPYVVSGTLEVAKGATLKIQAGTEIRFNPGAKILVNGELDVLGTVDDPVMMNFNPAATTSLSVARIWDGIEFGPDSVDAVFANGNYQSGSIIQNAIIKSSVGIVCNDASPYIANNQLSNNNIAINVTGTSASVGGLVLEATGNNNANKVKPIRIFGNTLSDNGIGIVVNRNNGQEYVATPVGYSYLGNKIITAYIDKNVISGSSIGVNIINGENSVVTNNTIRYNSGFGVRVFGTSRGAVIQGNDLNNNAIGLVNSTEGTAILQNNLKNNSEMGLVISAAPTVFSYNNFYNNKGYNLNNAVYNLAAANNYWGSVDSAIVESDFLLTNKTGSSTYTYPVTYKPFLTQEIDLKSILDPVINAQPMTTAQQATISGIKPLGASVYVNNTLITADPESLTWSYSGNLQLGDNLFSVYYQAPGKTSSAKKTITIQRFATIVGPTVNSYDRATTTSKITLSGTKPAGNSLLLNGQEIASADSSTIWSHTFDLNLGNNSWDLNTYDAVSKQTSPVVTINITRNKDTIGDIISAEQAVSVTPDLKLAARLAGRLLLQTENKGNIWYVNNKDNKRYLVTADNALSLFRSFSVGISEANLNKFPTKESGKKGDSNLQKKFAGKFLLRVEKGGNISYIDLNGYRHDISRDNLMNIFRSLSLGVSNTNIYKIPVGVLGNK